MICSWNEFVRRPSAQGAEASERWERRGNADLAPPAIGNDNRSAEKPRAALRGGGPSGERQFALALSLAKMLLATRGQFVLALRDASLAHARIDRPDALFLHTVEQNVDDALYAIGRDGPASLEEIVRRAIDDIVNDASITWSEAPFFAD